MAANPSGSLPEQMGGWNELRAAYRLVGEADVTHEALSARHWGKTYQEAQGHEAKVILWIQDTTEFNYNAHKGTTGLGSTSHSKVQGLMMHSALVVVPHLGTSEVLGLGWQHVWSRADLPEQSRFRGCESDKWSLALQQVGAVAQEGQRWVSVGDRESDVFAYFQQAKGLGWDCLSRVAQNRVIRTPSGERDWVKRFARAQAVQTHKRLELRGRSGQPKRTVDLQVSWSALSLHPPQPGTQCPAAPLECWCLRCWEQVPNGLEWILLTTLDPAQFSPLDQLEWYATRWLIEEYHKCLKTGCTLEARQLATAKRLITLMGFLSIVAVRLLQLRTLSRQLPHRPATEVVPDVMVRVLVVRLKLTTAQITLGEFWQAVARLGGFIGRKSDGQPGWQTLWRGWLRLQDLCWGVELGAGKS